MELWNKRQVDKNGKEMLLASISHVNGNITLKEREKISEDFFKPFHDVLKLDYEKSKIERENANTNMDNMKPYIFNADNLSKIKYNIQKAQQTFSDDNITLIRILDMIITSETKIEDEIEYNKLLDAIPEEAKEKMPKELITRKDVEKSIDELPSIEFMIKKNNGLFGDKVMRLLDDPIHQFAMISFYIFICDGICANFGITENVELEFGTTNEEYKDAVKDIKRVFAFGKRVKGFEKTHVYKALLNYTNLIDVLDREEYKQQQKELFKPLRELIQKGAKLEEMTELVKDNLFKQGWWYYDKEE